MFTALQLQLFMVQAVNYSVIIIVKIKCKTDNITNRKRLPWCELINPYNLFFIVNFSLLIFFTIRHRKRIGEMLKLPRLSRVSGASRSRPASRNLQRLVSVSSRILNVSFRSRLGQNFERLGLVSEGLVHIPVNN